MKKIMNSAEDFVLEMCKGIVKAHPELELIEKSKVIKRKNLDKNKVSLISGGGSGHEPAHAGFVGKGMLDAAVCGDVFASPSTVQVYNAIVKTASKKGTLLIIKNYTGDCMNFDGAAEMAREDDDLEVAQVYVNDDIAVKDSLYTVGRRGVAGTVFVHKIAGAAAEQGKSLSDVKKVSEKVIANVRSIGFALTSCTVPAKGSPTFQIGESEMEYGVGIHGEPGIAREAVSTSKELANRIIGAINEELSVANAEVAVMINGFGGTPLQELYILNNDVADALATKGTVIYKTMVGNFMTSIDMAGASVSVLKLDAELKALLDAESEAPAWIN